MLHPVIIQRPQMGNFVVPCLSRLLFLLKQITPPFQHLTVRNMRRQGIARITPEASDNLAVAPFSRRSQPVSKKYSSSSSSQVISLRILFFSQKTSTDPCRDPCVYSLWKEKEFAVLLRSHAFQAGSFDKITINPAEPPLFIF